MCRVETSGGRVEPLRKYGVFSGRSRVWLKNEASPGIAITRSFGDDIAHSVGCTSVPEVRCYTLSPGMDKCLVVASDGVWDVLSNLEVRNSSREYDLSRQSVRSPCQVVVSVIRRMHDQERSVQKRGVFILKRLSLGSTGCFIL